MSSDSGDLSESSELASASAAPAGLWGGRFEKKMSDAVARFTSSLPIDSRLWRIDLQGSLAHAKMLGAQGVLSPQEALQIQNGLNEIQTELDYAEREGSLPFLPQAEDIHSELERLLTEKIGPVAGKLHTARSRNDQVATCFRLYLAKESGRLRKSVTELQARLLTLAKDETETILPGLTHFQHAQPVSLAHHLLAYFWMLERDHCRLTDFEKRALHLPLGSAALAGTSFAIDRGQVAEELGFHELCENSLDAVSDRDFVIEFLAAVSTLMMHLSRFCEELIIWSGPEHGFVTLDDSVTTGSSIMPQKKNPDVAELIRGRSGRAFGALIGALTMMKGLPLAYNRDMQEDKYFAFQGLDVACSCVELMTLMLQEIHFHRDRMAESLMGDFSNATDLADDLAKKGLPFRQAHEVVGKVVRHCLATKRALENLTLTELQEFHPLINESSLRCLAHRAVLNARMSRGGAAPGAVLEQIERATKKLSGRL